MKKKLLTLVLVLSSLITYAQQKVIKTSDGNYTVISKKDTAKLSQSNFIDGTGVSHPVYISKNGKLYYNRISKTTGKEYKSYIKLNVD